MDETKQERLVYTPEEVARILQIGRNKAYELLHQGIIPSVRLGRQIRIPHHALMRWLGADDSDVPSASVAQ